MKVSLNTNWVGKPVKSTEIRGGEEKIINVNHLGKKVNLGLGCKI